MKEKLSQKVYDVVRGEILEGKYSPRDFISESQIAKEQGVSKAPVKEALHILADQGYLISYPRRGYMINTFSNEEINQIQEVRRTIETLCVQLAIKNATDDEIKLLRFFNEEEQYNMDPQKTINYRFHMGLAEISGNKFLPVVLKDLVSRATLGNIKGAPDLDNFNHIIDAMLERNEEEAVWWLKKDVRNL